MLWFVSVLSWTSFEPPIAQACSRFNILQQITLFTVQWILTPINFFSKYRCMFVPYLRNWKSKTKTFFQRRRRWLKFLWTSLRFLLRFCVTVQNKLHVSIFSSCSCLKRLWRNQVIDQSYWRMRFSHKTLVQLIFIFYLKKLQLMEAKGLRS